MYFFTDPTQLQTQQLNQAFGPISPQQYRATSTFVLQNACPAIACEGGQVILVQRSDNPALINLVLKPLSNKGAGIPSVRYYLYRGLKLNSFIKNGVLRDASDTSDGPTSALLARIWQDLQAQGQTNPLTQSQLIYDSSANVSLDRTFASSLIATSVRPGMTLGTFVADPNTPIGFEIIVDDYGLVLDLAYAQQPSSVIDAGSLSGLALQARRDSILSFIDPAAFFGIHKYSGLNVLAAPYTYTDQPAPNLVTVLLGNSVSTSVLSRFQTGNRAYIDVRNEFGRSYNFSGSYEISGQAIGIAGTLVPYATQSWPLLYLDLTSPQQQLALQLRQGTQNPSPVVYCETGRYANASDPGRPLSGSFFVPREHLLGTGTPDWTPALSFYFEGTGASYLKLHYYRPGLNLPVSTTVLQRQHPLDNLFDLSNLTDLPPLNNSSLLNRVDEEPALVASNGLTYAYVAESGFFLSIDRTVFYLREAKRFIPATDNQRSFAKPPAESTGLFPSGKQAGFLSTQVSLAARALPVSGVTPAPQVLTIYSYSGTPNYSESLFLLELTAAETQALAQVPDLSSLHPRYVTFEDTTPSGGLFDQVGEPCRRYRLHVQGLLNDGTRASRLPTPEVIVYASGNSGENFVLASANFTTLAVPSARAVTYKLNAEELRGQKPYNNGNSNNTSNSKPLAEYFKDADRTSGGLQATVNSFKSAIQSAQTYADFQAAVVTWGPPLFSAGMAYVQAGMTGNHEHTDRPLYWSRVLMAQALKQHPFFATVANLEVDSSGDSTSGILPGSALARILTKLDETTRNYTGVSFSAAGSAKKILVTGFDPFTGLFAVNPSGILAAAVHGLTLGTTKQGYVQVMVFPVRWRDFDSSAVPNSGEGPGMIEKYIGPLINQVDMIVTVSLNPNVTTYNIDHYATSTRSGGPDNLQDRRPSFDPVIRSIAFPPDSALPTAQQKRNYYEWLQTTLPPAMHSAPNLGTLYDEYSTQLTPLTINGAPYSPPLYRAVTAGNSQPPDDVLFTANSLTLPVDKRVKQQLLVGSGGAYMSNEIFYRVARLRELNRTGLPTGHLHVPGKDAAGQPLAMDDKNIDVVKYDNLYNLVQRVKQILAAGINAL